MKYWGSPSIQPTSTRLPTRRLCCQSARKTRILYEELLLGTSRRTENLKFLRQFHGTPRDFSFYLAGGRMNFARPMRTKSTRSNRHILNEPLFHGIWNLHPWPWCCFAPTGATMIPSLKSVLGNVTVQDNSIPTSTHITQNLTGASCPYKTPRGIDGT